jgi:hypothetical protein
MPPNNDKPPGAAAAGAGAGAGVGAGRLTLDLDGCRFGDDPPYVVPRRLRLRRHDHHRDHDHHHDHDHDDDDDDGGDDDDDHDHDHDDDHDGRNRRRRLRRPAAAAAGAAAEAIPPSPMGGTYRHEGLSIGRDFLRYRGRTLSEGLGFDDLSIGECAGRGTCGTVWRAVRGGKRGRRRGGDDDGDDRDEDDGDDDPPPRDYALKVFPLRDPDRRSMLVRELKVLCAFRCDCLVEMEGAFLDLDEDDDDDDDDDDDRGDPGARRRGGGNAVALALEYMDRGSLADVLASAGPPPWSALPEYAAASAAYQILWGLSYLHFEGVLHRDIKVGDGGRSIGRSVARARACDFFFPPVAAFAARFFSAFGRRPTGEVEGRKVGRKVVVRRPSGAAPSP